jgi:hypothetical protein
MLQYMVGGGRYRTVSCWNWMRGSVVKMSTTQGNIRLVVTNDALTKWLDRLLQKLKSQQFQLILRNSSHRDLSHLYQSVHTHKQPVLFTCLLIYTITE